MGRIQVNYGIWRFCLVISCIGLASGVSWLNPTGQNHGSSSTSATVSSSAIKESILTQGPASLQSLPDEVDLAFGMKDHTALLRLQRNKHISSDFNVILAEDDKPIQKTKNGVGEFAVYFDEVTQASVISVPDSQSAAGRSYMGTFEIGDERYGIEPLTLASTGGFGANIRPGSNSNVKQTEDMYNIFTMDGEGYVPGGEPRFDESRFEKINSFRGLYAASYEPFEYVSQTWVFLDASVYNQWYILSTGATEQMRSDEAVNNIRFFYSHVLNGMDLRIRSRYDSLKMSFEFSGLYIAYTPSKSPWTEDHRFSTGGEDWTNAYTALDDFEVHTYKQYELLQPMDQALLFTRYNLASFGSDGSYYKISGLGNIAGACLIDSTRQVFKGVSINYAASEYRTSGTSAHEAGHVHGARHDGSSNACAYTDQFIMASSPYTLTEQNLLNPFTYSPCSVDYFKNYMNYLNLNNQNCLTNTTNAKESFVDAALETHAGQKFNEDQQCKILFGPRSYYCAGQRNDENMCLYLDCFDPAKSTCVTNLEQRASNGTTCGKNKWCIKAKCVEDSRAPAAADYCRSGDYRGTLTDGVTCAAIRFGTVPLAECYKSTTFEQCCKTCSDLIGNNPSCPFGDSNPTYCKGIRPVDCYGDSVLSICCSTCSGYRKANPVAGCEYGDKASWCSTISPSECYINEKTCCEKCVPGTDTNCRYGDQASWCPGITSSQCYNDKEKCCQTCKKHQTNITGCEYGDLGSGYCDLSKCQTDPKFCCYTCRITTTSSTTTSTTPTSTTASTKATSTTASTKATSTTVKIATTATAAPEPSWCSNPIYVYQCYRNATVCPQTCPSRKTGITGCEYGDKRDWCTTVTAAECQYADYREACCITCERFLQSTTTQTPSTLSTENPLLGCTGANKYDWCSTSQNIDCGSCYNSALKSECCAKCKSCLSGTDPACLFGDKFPSYCKQQKPNVCYFDPVEADCCSYCKSVHTGLTGCEYGDVIDGCVADRCNEQSVRDLCCFTCKDYSKSVCTDLAPWCATMPSRDCYVSDDTCCNRCVKEYTGLIGCEYNDKVWWCENYIQTDDDCRRDDVKPNCCYTCLKRGIAPEPRGARGERGDAIQDNTNDGTTIGVKDSEISQIVKTSHKLVALITNRINEFCYKNPDECCKHFNMIVSFRNDSLKTDWLQLQDTLIGSLQVNSGKYGDEILFTLSAKLSEKGKSTFCKTTSVARRKRDTTTTYFKKERLEEIIITNRKDIEKEIEREIVRVGDTYFLQTENSNKRLAMILVPVLLVFAAVIVIIGLILYRSRQNRYAKYVDDASSTRGSQDSNHQMTFPYWTNSLTRPTRSPQKTLEAMPNVVTFH